MIRAIHASGHRLPCGLGFGLDSHSRTGKHWFFDKSVWQKMFRTMSGCGFNTVVLDGSGFLYRSAAELCGAEVALAGDIEQMRSWILAAARDYDLAPCLHILEDCLVPGPPRYADAGEIPCGAGGHLSQEDALRALRRVLEETPDLAGLVVEHDVSKPGKKRVLRLQSIVEEIDAARPDLSLYVSCGSGVSSQAVTGIQRRGGRPIHYLVPYTRDVLVDGSCSREFAHWVESARSQNILANVRAENFKPWTSFSYDTAEQVLSNLESLGCAGFFLNPLARLEWPHCSDEFFRFQWQRDMVWLSVWGGNRLEELLARGYPKWLLRNRRLVDGFQAASRILEVAGLYFAGSRAAAWLPQYCCLHDESGGRLLSIQDMTQTPEGNRNEDQSFWEDVTGDVRVSIGEYLRFGTPPGAYGPEEFIEEITDLASEATRAAEKGMRSASGEKELPGLARDAFCMSRLGEFYVERTRAALAYGRGQETEALQHISRSVGLYREIVSVDNSHRRWPVLAGRFEYPWTLVDSLRALEAEYADCRSGRFASGAQYRLRQGGEC